MDPEVQIGMQGYFQLSSKGIEVLSRSKGVATALINPEDIALS
jgi:hypothetical protein